MYLCSANDEKRGPNIGPLFFDYNMLDIKQI